MNDLAFKVSFLLMDSYQLINFFLNFLRFLANNSCIDLVSAVATPASLFRGELKRRELEGGVGVDVIVLLGCNMC